MTDRVRSLHIILDEDYRVDDVEEIMQAIRMIRGVETVEIGPINDMTTWLARATVGAKIERELFEALERARNGG